jgi:dolichyl-phosphate-mannose-protein mannosyltransferase
LEYKCERTDLHISMDWPLEFLMLRSRRPTANNQQYDAYKNIVTASPSAEQTAPQSAVPVSSAAAQVQQQEQQQQQQQPVGDGSNPKGKQPEISGAPQGQPLVAPPGAQRVLSREEKVEYRDQDGNLLNEAQVKELEGKVEFKTRYETRTRVVDSQGNELPQYADPNQQNAGRPGMAGEEAAVAPPHPDVEGADPETKSAPSSAAGNPEEPAEKSVEGVREAEGKKAQPASDGNEATAL